VSVDTNQPTEPNLGNPYLTGAYAPVRDELVAHDLVVEGRIPEALQGVYMRNGANPAFPPLTHYHLFDGDGMIHAVELRDGRASYRNRFIESAGLRVEQRVGHAVFGGLGEFVMPPPEIVAEAGFMKNTANTNIVRHADRYFALMEAGKPTELTRELATLGEYDFGGRLSGPMTAHPKWDATTGELLFFGYSPLPPYLKFHVVDASGALTRSIDVELPRPVMMHDFVVTDEHVIFFDLPAVFDIESLLGGGVPIRWEGGLPARIGVLPRDLSVTVPTWFELDPFYVFHFLDGWTEHSSGGTQIVVHGCRADRMPVAFGADSLPEPTPARLHRWTIDLEQSRVTDEPCDEQPGDFPRFNEAHTARRRYGYVARSSRWGQTVQFTEVARHDLQTGSVAVHDYGDRAVVGEAVFAPDPDRDGELDGWLLNLVTDLDTDRAELVIIDAADMEGDPVARVHMPRRVPFGFHGNWMPD
jgi:carotenoid cleavage dioxygenase-like enzyme